MPHHRTAGVAAPQVDQLCKKQGELQELLARSEAEKRALQRKLGAPGREPQALIEQLQAEVARAEAAALQEWGVADKSFPAQPQ
jgi:hypothetical protein